jgi:hypothetical protein
MKAELPVSNIGFMVRQVRKDAEPRSGSNGCGGHRYCDIYGVAVLWRGGITLLDGPAWTEAARLVTRLIFGFVVPLYAPEWARGFGTFGTYGFGGFGTRLCFVGHFR